MVLLDLHLPRIATSNKQSIYMQCNKQNVEEAQKNVSAGKGDDGKCQRHRLALTYECMRLWP